MKKQKVQLFLLAAVFVLLLVGLLALRTYNHTHSEAEEPEETSLCDLPTEDVIRLAYDYQETRYEYDKEDDVWYYTPDHQLNLTQTRITSIVSAFSRLTAGEAIPDVTDFDQYGLGEDARTVTLETADRAFTLRIGSYNEILEQYYVCIPEESTVYLVESSGVNLLNLDVMDIVEEEEESTESTEE